MRTGIRTTVAAAALFTFLISGCGASGGSDDASDTTTSTQAGSGEGSTTTDDRSSTTEVDGSTTTVGSTSTVGSDGKADVCVALKRISDFDASTQGADTRPWPELRQTFIDGASGVIGAYDEALAVGEPDLAADLTQLRDITAPTADLAAQSSSIEEFAGKIREVPGIFEAGQAGQRLDTYARANCSFGTSSAGGPIG